MATPYSKIYEAFVFKVKAYDLLMLLEEDREDILYLYMISVCRKVAKTVKTYANLADRDDEVKEFQTELDDDMIDIIAECMITEWLKPQMYSDELLESRLNTKDFTEYSPAKLIEQMRYVYEMSKKESRVAINNYTFSHGDIAELNKS
jgi:hypothetical protein|nr:MAG TPA: hypothetical protein [Caudoviricetes sp.]